jgi:hypothetical protein
MTQLDALDGARRLRPVDLEREWRRVEELVPGVSREKMREEMAVVTPEGRVLRGFLAAREVSRTLPALGSCCRWCMRRERSGPGRECTRGWRGIGRGGCARGIRARYMGCTRERREVGVRR